MGCDIHLYREKFVNGEWVSADEWTTVDYGMDCKECYDGRDYDLFGLLVNGVRREHPFSWI